MGYYQTKQNKSLNELLFILTASRKNNIGYLGCILSLVFGLFNIL